MSNLIAFCLGATALQPITQYLAYVVFILGLSLQTTNAFAKDTEEHIVKQVTVYYESGRFAAWPANHGMWVWGNELLVGFSRGYHQDLGEEFHNIHREKPEEFLLARSIDGGLSWSIEYPLKKGDLVPRGEFLHGTELPGVPIPPLMDCPGGIDLMHPDFAMTLRLDNKDGGKSRFSYSYDRGKNWEGPFKLPDMGTPGISARTDYIVDDKSEAMFFLTAAKLDGLEGRVFCASTNDGCKTFDFISWIGEEVAGYEIMPSSVRISPTELLTTTRVREPNYGPSWIDSYASQDNGKTWEYLGRPVADTGEGNPPSMLKLKDGRICLTYGFRAAPYKMCAKLSSDGGKTWSDEILLRSNGGGRDMGYPYSKQCDNGNIVTTYYFWDKQTGPERYIAATLWDPSKIPSVD
jgi:hypothetical protein